MITIEVDKSFNCIDGSYAAFKIHTIKTGADTYFTNAFLIETEFSLIAIDALMTVSDAVFFRNLINSIDKKLSAVVITHPHPDHYAGLGVLIDGLSDVHTISTKNVVSELSRIDPLLNLSFKEKYGTNWPEVRPLPHIIVNDGDIFTFDGVDFEVKSLGAGESDWDTIWFVGKEKLAVFVGDLLFGKVHSYMADGYTQSWLQNLSCLEDMLSGMETAYTGHGCSGNVVDLIRFQRDYLNYYWKTVKSILMEFGEFNEESRRVFLVRIKDFLPTDDLECFILGGVNAVIAEIRAGIKS